MSYLLLTRIPLIQAASKYIRISDGESLERVECDGSHILDYADCLDESRMRCTGGSGLPDSNFKRRTVGENKQLGRGLDLKVCF